MIKSVNHFLLNTLLIFFLLYCSVYAGWFASYSNYFFFPVIYELEDIRGNVFEYAPKNTAGKEDFVFVSSGAHLKIFGEMLRGVNNEGEGLDEITYRSNNVRKKFLTSNELTHLQDVADMITMLKSFMKLILVLLVSVVGTMVVGRVYPFNLSRVLWSMGAFIAGLGLLINKYGFVKIFYFMHDATFPKNHEWFFYYEDSLMSTLLKAPDSFVPMGVVLGFCSLVSFIIMYAVVSKLIIALMKR
ncbi:MAG: hypothetical protein C0603_13150 [Denitrovibrio sp.]|nr:MAG: hypothetical protein C0603_13150 [Denitrovibrio sp.]